MSMALVLRPRMSEKAYGLSQSQNTFVFDVPLTANKAGVTAAVASQFGVTVEDVRLSILKGKVKRSYKKRSRPAPGKRTDVKKAYVRLKKGDSINIFEATEEKKPSVLAEAMKTAAAKQAGKPEKQGRIRQALGRSPRQTQNKGGEK